MIGGLAGKGQVGQDQARNASNGTEESNERAGSLTEPVHFGFIIDNVVLLEIEYGRIVQILFLHINRVGGADAVLGADDRYLFDVDLFVVSGADSGDSLKQIETVSLNLHDAAAGTADDRNLEVV